MKKILLLVTIALIFAGCSKDDNEPILSENKINATYAWEKKVDSFSSPTIIDKADMVISLSPENQYILITYAPYSKSQKSIADNEDLARLKNSLLKQMAK